MILNYPVKIKKSQLIEYPAALLRLGFFIVIILIVGCAQEAVKDYS